MPIASVNPADGTVGQTFEPFDAERIESILSAASRAFARWRIVPIERRCEMLAAVAERLDQTREGLARLAVAEMGKPIVQARAELEKCAWACRHYAQLAPQMLADEPAPTDAQRSYVRFEPLGVVLAVMPWNFPFWQVFRFAAPALAAGNVGILKHASNVPQCAMAIERVFREAGALEDVFQTVLVESRSVEAIVDDPRISAVTLTGSEAAGAAVASRAAKVIKKAVLELGGSDPYVVMPSADLDAAVATAVNARTINNGQSCIAAKRFVVHRDVYAEFERRFIDGFRALRVGDPMDEATQIGPLVNAEAVATLERQVRDLQDAGGTVLVGATRMERPGNYVEPGVIAGANPRSAAVREEIFGPVAMLFEAASLDEAIEIANATDFGLGSSVWTKDAREQQRFIEELQAGSVFVNGMVKSDPRLPFGGVKRSGFGRELSVAGIREFVNVKTVWIGGG